MVSPERQGHLGVQATESKLEAAVQELSALIELAGGEELVGEGEVVGHGGSVQMQMEGIIWS